eukprot:4715920-Heterocapsa_arctica.AAC.1
MLPLRWPRPQGNTAAGPATTPWPPPWLLAAGNRSMSRTASSTRRGTTCISLTNKQRPGTPRPRPRRWEAGNPLRHHQTHGAARGTTPGRVPAHGNPPEVASASATTPGLTTGRAGET